VLLEKKEDKEPKQVSTLDEVKNYERCKLNKKNNEPLIGLAFSGGGIRSATINLGVLQVLAKHELFKCFDYLSTVSGGGYIGAYISSLIYHKEKIRNLISAQSYMTPQTRLKKILIGYVVTATI
jgi:predicted acylesterase/phospholipase RssA